ncbi:MAG: 2-isopropylmalate synthase, partial [Candidatus Methylomirabilis sp.]|nr:2-isopropylmalate synthase [Deltaproteobacteria bacterium]
MFTVGYTVPWEYERLIRHLREKVPNIEMAVISVHCHNDLGMATANSLAAVRAGARQIECTINGIGERAGNTAMEEVVMALKTRQGEFHADTGINTRMIMQASHLIRNITGFPVQPNKAVVGANAFAHEAGIHQDGVLKNTLTYEIMTAESVGLSSNKLVLGKHSGRAAFRDRLRSLGYELGAEPLNEAFRRFKELADRKKTVYDEDIVAIVTEEMSDIPERIRLEYLTVASGNLIQPAATVSLKVGEETVRGAAFGAGPVDAAFTAIRDLTGTTAKLLEYNVQAITGGTDAQGSVSVKIEEDDMTVNGHGSDPDIVVASAKAYISALNRLAYRRSRGSVH